MENFGHDLKRMPWLLVGLGLWSCPRVRRCIVLIILLVSSWKSWGSWIRIVPRQKTRWKYIVEDWTAWLCCHSESRKHRALANEQRRMLPWESLGNITQAADGTKIMKSGQRGPLSSNDLILLLFFSFIILWIFSRSLFLSTTTFRPMTDNTQSKSKAAAPPAPRKVRFNVGMEIYSSRLLAIWTSSQAHNTRSSMSSVKEPMALSAQLCIDQVVARLRSRKSPPLIILCFVCGHYANSNSLNSWVKQEFARTYVQILFLWQISVTSLWQFRLSRFWISSNRLL